MGNMIAVKQATAQGYIPCKSGGAADLSYPTSQLRRGRVQGGGNVTATITTTPQIARIYLENGEVKARFLSVREIGRLMGVRDSDIDKMLSVNAERQVIKQFGNSIVTTVLMALFSQLNIQGIKAWNDMEPGERQALTDETKDWIKERRKGI